MRVTWQSTRRRRVRVVAPSPNAMLAQEIADAVADYCEQTRQPATDERIVTVMHQLKASRHIRREMPVRAVRLCLPGHLNMRDALPDLDTL